MWSDVLIIMIRNLTNDIGIVQNFTDDQIAEAAAVAAMISSREFPFKTQYAIDVVNVTISPDPTLAPTIDNDAVALWSLKAACLANQNAFYGGIGQGIKVRDDTSSVDTTGGLASYANLLKLGPCQSYRELFKLLTTRKSMSSGRVIIGNSSHMMAPWGNFTMLGNFSARGFFDYFLRF